MPRVAPTARDEEGRADPGKNPDLDQLLRGTVHDTTARRMGGVAGDAGVFSTAHDVGVYAQAEGALGDIKVTGLRREEDHWISEGYGYAKMRIHLDVRGGVGQINLLVE